MKSERWSGGVDGSCSVRLMLRLQRRTPEERCSPLARKLRFSGNWELRETSWATVLSFEVFPLNVLSQLHWSFSLINPTRHQVLSDRLWPPSPPSLPSPSLPLSSTTPSSPPPSSPPPWQKLLISILHHHRSLHYSYSTNLSFPLISCSLPVLSYEKKISLTLII